jgi:tetratricopeptide (TPR) repeat protein
VSVLAAAVALADLCGATPEPPTQADAADAAAYTAVGDEARDAGDLRAAVIAYRKAIAADPGYQRPAAELAAICRDDGRQLLLDAIARFSAGEHGAAAAALSEIVRTRGTASAGAHFFLALIALERHDAAAAIRELEIAHGDPDYRELAEVLLRLARRDGRLAFALLVEPELDTNPQLLPDTPPAGAATGAPSTDEDLLAVATVTARPAPWLALRNTLIWRNQRQLSALDFVGDDLEVAAELSSGRNRVAIRYDLDYDQLAGARYLIANRAGVGVRHDGGVLSAVASYALRRRDFARDTEQPFTGWVHTGDAGVAAQVGGIELDARATLRRELTGDASFANLAAGLRLALRTRATSSVRLIASAAAGYARYDAAQPDGQFRRDVAIDASADLEIDLGDHVVAVAGTSVAHNASSIEDFRYDQLVARCGLVVAWGVP